MKNSTELAQQKTDPPAGTQEEDLDGLLQSLQDKFGELEDSIKTRLEGLMAQIDEVEKTVDEVVSEFTKAS